MKLFVLLRRFLVIFFKIWFNSAQIKLILVMVDGLPLGSKFQNRPYNRPSLGIMLILCFLLFEFRPF